MGTAKLRWEGKGRESCCLALGKVSVLGVVKEQ